MKNTKMHNLFLQNWPRPRHRRHGVGREVVVVVVGASALRGGGGGRALWNTPPPAQGAGGRGGEGVGARLDDDRD